MSRPTQRFKLGKAPARKDAVKLKLRDYLTPAALPAPRDPNNFGHEELVKLPWDMLGNDQFGDCVWAGAAHETMLFNAAAGRDVRFDADHLLADYSTVTGFSRADPNSDQGTDVQLAASYRRDVGVADATGTRHKVAVYLAITPGDVHEHILALYLFGAVGLGIRVPSYAQDQFTAGQPWSKRLFYNIEGGHYVPIVARRGGQFIVVTWGREQAMTDGFFKTFNDESVVYLSEEALNHGQSLEGFNDQQLLADLSALESA
jgi:hypothetical protein